MHELVRKYGDAAAVLALAPEELARDLIGFMKARMSRANSPERIFNAGNLIGEAADVHRPPHFGEQAPLVACAVSEALAWLSGQGLLALAPGHHNGWLILSRRALAMELPEGFDAYLTASKLPRELLHPAIADRVWVSFIRGEYDTAAFQALRQVEIAVREAGGFAADDYGVSLARAAFRSGDKDGAHGPLTDLEAPAGEQRGMMDLFAGALGALKNPHSHRAVNYETPEDAAAVVILASHLLRIVDRQRRATDD